MRHCIHLPLTHTANTRDLGGYVTRDGRITKWNVFIRSDDPGRLDTREQAFLREYGVSTIIDLRSPAEVEEMPHPSMAGIEDVNIPLVHDLAVCDLSKIESEDMGSAFIQLNYINILENSADQIRKVFETIYNASGAVLFHCAIGKDRTGIIAALLLGLVNVDEHDIVANYEVSYSYLSREKAFLDRIDALVEEKIPVENFYSKMEYIQGMLRHVADNYGSVRAYLQAIGLQDDALDAIAARFTQVF